MSDIPESEFVDVPTPGGPVAQVDTIVFDGAVAGGQIYVVSVVPGANNATYTALAGDNNQSVADAMVLLLRIFFPDQIWTVQGATITGTASVPGVGFTTSVSATAPGHISLVHTTANVPGSSTAEVLTGKRFLALQS